MTIRFDSIVTYYISSSIPGHGFSKHDFSWYPDPIHSSPKGSSLLSCIFNLTLLRIPSPQVALHGDQSSCHSAHKQFTAMHWLTYSMRHRGKLSYKKDLTPCNWTKRLPLVSLHDIFILQFWITILLPIQACPPFLAEIALSRDFVWVPPPQLVEQLDHSVQLLQVQSTGSR